MKNSFFVSVALVVLAFSTLSRGDCPEDANDRGECDTLNVICLDCEIDSADSAPYFVRFPLLVTHDQTDEIDSIAGFSIPLTWTHTNPAKYCSVSAWWNETYLFPFPPQYLERSVFRHLEISPGDSMINWMMRISEPVDESDWNTLIVELDGTSNVGLYMTPTGQQDQKWWEGDRVLLATITFRIEDEMEVCIDSTSSAPDTSLRFSRSDSVTYTPRHNLPACFWVGPSGLNLSSPVGGENWGVGTTEHITWVWIPEKADQAIENIKIEYSTNSGTDWITVEDSTPNTGSYPWLIPATLSDSCRVKISDALDGDPYDISQADFSIVEIDFTLEAAPDTQIVAAGQSADFNVVLTSLFGFASPCTLTAAGEPGDASADFVPNPITPTDSSLLTIATAETTPPDTYTVTVTATELTRAQIQHSTEVVLIVIPPLDFTIEAWPDTLEISQGTEGSYDVALTSISGFNSPCTLTVSALPQDASGQFDPASLVPTDTSTLTVTAGEATPTGTYLLTITATELAKAQIEHSVGVVLVVTPGVPDFSIGATPDTQTVLRGHSVDYGIGLNSLFGFASPCTLTATGLPDGGSAGFNPNPITPTDSSLLTVSTAGTTPPDTYVITVTATELAKSQVQHSTEVVLIVTRLVADFSANPTTGVVPLDVNFADLSTGNPTAWFWHFGDGATDTLQNPMHTYNDTGYFDVELTVWSETDADSITREDYIRATSGCPEDQDDHGICDSMYIEPWPADTLLEGEPPYLVRVPIYVTHDVADPSYDSLIAFVIPMSYTHSNPSKYCSVSTYWNDPQPLYPWPDSLIRRSIFRHFINPADSSDTIVHNRMMDLSQDFMTMRAWDTRILDLDDTSYFRLAVIATEDRDQGWWEGSKILLATVTFTLEDTMQICIDTCLWPPTSNLRWARSDVITFVPRLGTPHSPDSYEFCFNVRGGFRAEFSAEPESGFAPLSVQFTDLSTGDPTSWL